MESGYSMLDPRMWYESYKLVSNDMQSLCSDSIAESPELMKMINEHAKVDVVITLSTCGSYLAHVFDSPIILFSPAGAISFHLDYVGSPINLMIQPSLLAPFIEPMTFVQRMANILVESMVNIYMQFIDSIALKFLREQFGEDIPRFEDILQQRS